MSSKEYIVVVDGVEVEKKEKFEDAMELCMDLEKDGFQPECIEIIEREKTRVCVEKRDFDENGIGNRNN